VWLFSARASTLSVGDRGREEVSRTDDMAVAAGRSWRSVEHTVRRESRSAGDTRIQLDIGSLLFMQRYWDIRS
jgi:hypothetical protein